MWTIWAFKVIQEKMVAEICLLAFVPDEIAMFMAQWLDFIYLFIYLSNDLFKKKKINK